MFPIKGRAPFSLLPFLSICCSHRRPEWLLCVVVAALTVARHLVGGCVGCMVTCYNSCLCICVVVASHEVVLDVVSSPENEEHHHISQPWWIMPWLPFSATTCHRVRWLCVCVCYVLCVLWHECVCFNGMMLYEQFLAGKLRKTHHQHLEVVAGTFCHRLPPSWWPYWTF